MNTPQDKATQDQIAAVMLFHGTPEQQAAVLKPRIKLSGGRISSPGPTYSQPIWQCTASPSLDAPFGVGTTPAGAYEDWLSTVRFIE